MNNLVRFHLPIALTLIFGVAVCKAQEETGATVEKTKHKVVRVDSAADNETGTPTKRRVVRVYTGAEGEGEERSEVVYVGKAGPGAFEYSFLPSKRGYLGVQLVELTPELRVHFGAPEAAGVLVSRVAADSPAGTAGLRVGDVLTAIDEVSVATNFDVARRISNYEDGAAATLEVWRDRRVQTITATVVTRERPAIDLGRFLLPGSNQLREGISIDLDDLPEQVIEIDEEGIHKALRDFQLRFADPGMMEKFQTLEGNRLDLRERIRELEQRLEELERHLEKLPEK